jgi:PIN domain nuclease of toxin-antitoxin system
MLLDTHVLIWLLLEDARLGRAARQTITTFKGQAYLSAITAWEIGMLVGKGRVGIADVAGWFDEVVAEGRFEIVPVGTAIAIDAGTLQAGVHGDPADRILIATARWLDCPLVTVDGKILDYAAAGYLKVIDARR